MTQQEIPSEEEVKEIRKEYRKLVDSWKKDHPQWGQNEEFAKIADQEGFDDIAAVFRAIAAAEKQHEKRYLALRDNILNNRVFKRDKPIKWRCRNCGYIHEGKEAPKECPACAHPQSYYELLCENY